jgi:Lrp/AsnC family leucine-responsive transcriptional regulator
MAMTVAPGTRKSYRLNNTDRGILGLLREDGRMQVSELAARLGVSRTTVRNRIDMLCERNIIKRFTIELDREHADSGSPSSAFFLLQLKRRMCRLIFHKIKGWPELRQAWSLSGQNDMLLLVHAVDNEGIEDLRARLIRDPEIVKVETVIVLSEWLKQTQEHGRETSPDEIRIEGA